MSDARMRLAADLLADGYEPDEVTVLAMVDRRIRQLVNRSVDFHLIADNKDRPDAGKYGTHPDGSARYAPEWYMAQSIGTAMHEGLYGALREVLTCDSVGPHGEACVGSVLHSTCHWDGNGENWIEQ